MKKTYRIVKCTGNGSIEYLVERKSIFGFWYNPDNVDEYTTGYYNSLEEAERAIKWKIEGVTSEVIKQIRV